MFARTLTQLALVVTMAIGAPLYFTLEAKSDDAQNHPAIIVDAPDLRKVPENVIGPRFSSLLGQKVYSNTGKEIGEIEDFVMARGGEMYAVIDVAKGPINEIASLIDDEIVIVSLREFRRSPLPKAD